MNQYNRHPLIYLVPQVIAHLALFYALFTFSVNDWLITIAGYILISGLGISVTWHRLQTHKAADLPIWVRHTGCILGCFALQGTLLGWVAKHIQHHRHSDTHRDPHSPQHTPVWKMYWTNLIISTNLENRYIVVALKDPLNIFYHKWHFVINGIYALVLWLIEPSLLLSLWLVPAAIGWIMTGWGVAAWSHQWGTVNYQLNDHSRNNHVIGLLAFGEGYQNNHHKYPYKAKLSQSPWEVDPLGYILERLSKSKFK